jgi:MOSC domain-containing protein YiiM
VESITILEPGSKVESTPVESIEVTPAGFKGDRHAGLTRRADVRTKDVPRGTEVRNDRQVTIVAREELAQVALALGIPEIRPEWMGANLCLRGLEGLSTLPRGSRLVFPGGVVLWVEAQNKLCTAPGRAIQAAYPDRPDLATSFPKLALGLRGLVASVERPGHIAAGDPVDVALLD